MTHARLSRLAVVAVACWLPPVAAIAWCVWVFRTATGTVAGEVLLVPGLCWLTFAPLGAVCGANALAAIRRSGARLRGRWLAAAGLALAFAPSVAVCLAVLVRALARPAD